MRLGETQFAEMHCWPDRLVAVGGGAGVLEQMGLEES